MKRFMMIATVALLIPVTSAFAHHRFGDEFDAKAPITLKGTVTKVEWGNPHVMIYADVKDKDGRTANWAFEAAGPALMEIKGWKQDMFKAGDEISVQGYKAKTEPNHAAARMITLADGKSLSSAPDDGGPKT
jgi:hypothetical protein